VERSVRRVGVLYPTRSATSRENWSGSPAGIASGLEARGLEVVPIGTAVPHPTSLAFRTRERLGRRDPLRSRSQERTDLRTEVLRLSVRRNAPLDALVAMGTDLYELARCRPHDVPVATFDDGTLAQQWRNADSDIRGMAPPEGLVRQWCATQAASSRAADVCCVSTSWAAESFVRDYQVRATDVRVVGMGHRPRRAAGNATRSWTTPRFLLVGVDWQRKNGAAVLEAFRHVRAEVPGATLHVVGRHPRLDEAGVVGHGLLSLDDPEAQARLDHLFATATAFVLPSRFDPSPIAYLEAASAGLPVVATTEGGAGELLGEAAISVGPDDHRALVAAMLRLTGPEEAARLGALSALRAEDATWTAVAGRILDALDLAPRLDVSARA
jgi:glycosyltransferase involved in cell wall biosynthesis